MFYKHGTLAHIAAVQSSAKYDLICVTSQEKETCQSVTEGQDILHKDLIRYIKIPFN